MSVTFSKLSQFDQALLPWAAHDHRGRALSSFTSPLTRRRKSEPLPAVMITTGHRLALDNKALCKFMEDVCEKCPHFQEQELQGFSGSLESVSGREAGTC